MARIAIVLTAALVVAFAGGGPAQAQQADWLTRCNSAVGQSSAPENGKYLYQTRGKLADPARVEFDYTTAVSARAATYPGAAKDVLNPYSSPSFSLGYYGAVAPTPPHAIKPAIGHVSFGFSGKNFKPIPGAPITVRLVLDGVAFGPFAPSPSSLNSGMYSIWLDTAETDGDSKPPLLSPADFAKLAAAVDRMKTLEIALVQDGADIVRAAIPFPQLAGWRAGLAAWGAKTKPGVGPATLCSAGGEVVN